MKGQVLILQIILITSLLSGLSYQVNKPAIGSGFGGAPTCSRCSQRVYFNEEKRAIGKVWHVRCFTCGKLSLVIYLSWGGNHFSWTDLNTLKGPMKRGQSVECQGKMFCNVECRLQNMNRYTFR